jgi:hypothetical protein
MGTVIVVSTIAEIYLSIEEDDAYNSTTKGKRRTRRRSFIFGKTP